LLESAAINGLPPALRLLDPLQEHSELIEIGRSVHRQTRSPWQIPHTCFASRHAGMTGANLSCCRKVFNSVPVSMGKPLNKTNCLLLITIDRW